MKERLTRTGGFDIRCQGFRSSVDRSGRSRSRVPYDGGRTMAVIKSVDNETVISVVSNLPVTKFI